MMNRSFSQSSRMVKFSKLNNWFYFKLLVVASFSIPLLYLIFEMVWNGKESVTLLIDQPYWITIVIVVYYLTLLTIGIIWILRQMVSVMTLKNERKKGELQQLQSKVNPHFFFNMLNNLYGLIDINPEKAKNLILKLSDLMRYGIYEGDKQEVALKEEVEYLQQFIELQQMRYHKKIDIHFNIDIDQQEHQVMPLMFIILLENAFKHGVEKLRTGAFVKISMVASDRKIQFMVENNFDPAEVSPLTGIGLSNLQRRLELKYPRKHELKTTSKGDIYRASLSLIL